MPAFLTSLSGDCGRPSKLLTVSKEGASKGKKFYGCDGRVCDYFCWEENVGVSSRAAPISKGSSTSYGNSTNSTSLNYRPTTQGQSSGGYGANLNTADTNIVCNCGTSARKLTVKKEGPSQGKEFFTCSVMPKVCGFFLWADADYQSGGSSGNSWGSQGGNSWGPQGGNSFSSQNNNSWNKTNNNFSSQRRTQNTFSSMPRRNNNNAQSGEKSCDCGQPAVTRTVKKDGPNKGRVFWTCSKQFGDSSKCNLFDWADDAAGGAGGGSSQMSRKRPPPSGGGGGGASKQRCCSVCRQPGHSKRNCPQNNDF